MLFDIHGDIWADVTEKRQKGLRNIIRDYHLERFRKGNMVGGIFVIWIDPPHDKRPEERFIESIQAMSSELWESKDIIKVIHNSNDFYKAIGENKIAVLLGLEGLSGIGEDIESIYTLYQLGFRHGSLTWNEENPLGTGARGDVNRGLTKLGKEAIKIMESVGMILDVSHANDKTFWDIYNVAEKPFIASHSNSRTLCNVPRNLTDEQIKAIGEVNGIVGINAFNEFIHEDKSKRNVDYLINHIEYIVDIIGIDKVALGFDFFEYIGKDTANTFTEDDYVGTKGLENISKGNDFVLKLRERGFTKEDIEKIGYKNFLSLMNRVL